MTGARPSWPVAMATHAAREVIGQGPGSASPWPGLLAFLDWTAAAGFDGVDFSDSVVPFDRPLDGLGELAQALAARGLRAGGLNLLRASLADPDFAAESLERARHAIRAAAALGVPVLSLSLALPRQVDDCNCYRGLDHSRGGSRDATDAAFETTAGHLRALAAEARASGIALSIETHHASLADNGAATLRLWRLTGDASVGVNPDLVNAYWAYAVPEEDWRETLALLAPQANVWHVKNVRRIETDPGRRASYLGTTLGDGDIDYRFAVRTMRDAGFAGWVSIERGGPGDALAQALSGLRYLWALMGDDYATETGNALQG